MYNRYIPQPDGSYRRSPGQSPGQQPAGAPPSPPLPPDCPPPPGPPNRPVPPHPAPDGGFLGIGRFLRQLLPGNFDTEDLLIVLLLLLMSGDCDEDRNFALLTLALYLFM